MRLMDTAEGATDPVGKLISADQPLGLNYLAFAMNPLGLYRIEPRTFGGQQTRHYPDPAATIFDVAVVGGDPASHPMALMPACVVPNKEQGLLASPLELLAEHHPRNCVVIALTGLPSTNLSQVSLNSSRYIP
jgi:hypothetical protein